MNYEFHLFIYMLLFSLMNILGNFLCNMLLGLTKYGCSFHILVTLASNLA